MKVFKTKSFGRFARKKGLEDALLLKAAADAAAGRIDADLGGGVIKQRVARKGGGKSGGFRTDSPLSKRLARLLCVRLRKERKSQHINGGIGRVPKARGFAADLGA